MSDEGEAEEDISCQIDKYGKMYKDIWHYCWNHMIDHKYGAWYRIRYVEILIVV